MPDTPATPGNKGRILVVDDEVLYVQLLRAVLEQNGYTVTDANDGESALRAVAKDPPDLVLLDVVMPGMDGFDVCRRLKEDPATTHIPVLMVTSLTERQDRLKGISAGARDFLSKPIDAEEVLLRANNMVYAKKLFDRQKRQYQQLRELEAHRDDLVHMIVHDMRNPLMAMQTVLVTILRHTSNLPAETRDRLTHALGTVQNLSEMANAVLDVSRFEADKMPLHPALCDVAAVAREAVESVKILGDVKGIRITVEGRAAPVEADADLVRRIFVNLLSNAIKYSPEKGSVRITLSDFPGHARITVADAGPGIPARYHDKIFDKFGQVEEGKDRQRHSVGLGLPFCRLAVEAHGGKISLVSSPGRGSEFSFTLPRGKAR